MVFLNICIVRIRPLFTNPVTNYICMCVMKTQPLQSFKRQTLERLHAESSALQVDTHCYIILTPTKIILATIKSIGCCHYQHCLIACANFVNKIPGTIVSKRNIKNGITKAKGPFFKIVKHSKLASSQHKRFQSWRQNDVIENSASTTSFLHILSSVYAMKMLALSV